MSILRTEPHLHLYGCLQAKDLWEIGRDRYLKLADRLQWFEREYAAAYGERVNTSAWWTSDHGFEDMRRCFEFTESGPFPRFQAKFNLLIALNPPNPDDLTLANAVFRRDQIHQAAREYRTFLPHYLPPAIRETYLLNLLRLCKEYATKDFRPLIALSMMRDETIADELYAWLIYFAEKHPWIRPFVTGIDFCGNEAGHPPRSKKVFMERLSQHETCQERPWQVLYHVGEMWDEISLASAARWVVEAAQYGIQRIGHGMALGVDPDILLGQSTREPQQEYLDHITWLELHNSSLTAYGYTLSDQTWYRQRANSALQDGVITWNWDRALCDHVKHLQDALLQMIRALNPVIEVCVTSNLRIGQLTSPSQHPLRKFLDHGLRVVAATDDPGIFSLMLAREEQRLRDDFLCDDAILKRMEIQAQDLLRT